MIKWPKKLSDLLEMAYNDFRASIRSRRFRPSMGCFLEIDEAENEACVGCVAGGVLYQAGFRNGHGYWDEHHKHLAAIDGLRQGAVSRAAYQLGFKGYKCWAKFDRKITHFASSRRKFYAEIRQLIADLRADNR